ncbi:MAG: twin-arginine translocase TatA/TatE family subunit [Chloroflexi bacterium]|nr:twin-arginine translocase TatA/TatE family subunit [Chloroflexota bacterium]
MEFLGISPVELIVILVILFLVLGPQDLVKLGGTLGRALRNLRESGTWRSIQDARRQLRDLPENLAREAGLEEVKKLRSELKNEIKETQAKLNDLDHQIVAWTRQPDSLSQKKAKEENPEKQKTDGEY